MPNLTPLSSDCIVLCCAIASKYHFKPKLPNSLSSKRSVKSRRDLHCSCKTLFNVEESGGFSHFRESGGSYEATKLIKVIFDLSDNAPSNLQLVMALYNDIGEYSVEMSLPPFIAKVYALFEVPAVPLRCPSSWRIPSTGIGRVATVFSYSTLLALKRSSYRRCLRGLRWIASMTEWNGVATSGTWPGVMKG